jgi:Raf kinase inhibitor-like YbhB/YbcL family protein
VTQRRRGALFVTAGLLLCACSSKPSGSGDAEHLNAKQLSASIRVTSLAFIEGDAIPRRFTCDGNDVSPPLRWIGVPAATRSIAVVVDDPDAPKGPYVHWVEFGLRRSVTTLTEGDAPAGTRQAKNSAGDAAYKGPCPPKGDGAHHYRFTIYALREDIAAPDGAKTGTALQQIAANAIAKGQLTGTYDR